MPPILRARASADDPSEALIPSRFMLAIKVGRDTAQARRCAIRTFNSTFCVLDRLGDMRTLNLSSVMGPSTLIRDTRHREYRTSQHPVRENYGTLDDVLQFPHIARPGMTRTRRATKSSEILLIGLHMRAA
jgi:hypothetical protein